ncbi:MAG: CARDB domain-containing protein [Anaerolineae bacterium]
MWRRMTSGGLLALALLLLVGGSIFAQDVTVTEPAPTETAISTETPLPTATPTEETPIGSELIAPTAVPQLAVSQTEPSQITAGQSATLSILGANFSASTTVRLVGFGFLTTSFVNSGALTAALPASIPVGSYTIEIADPTYGTATAPGSLTVVAAPVATTPAVSATPTPTATAVPGQPRLTVNTFSASPSSIYPGGTTTFTIEVYNVGSRTAEGVVLSLGDSKFTPANGQASVTLPDLPAMTSYVVTLSVTAPSDAAEGPQSIALVLTSRDFSGQTYTNSASVSVNVLATTTGASQVILDSYVVDPSTAEPGDTVTLRALFRNTGTETADQVLIQLDGTNGVLIAGADGNAYAVGDMPPGAGAAVVMSFIVSSSASAGAQAQALTISYLQDDEAKQNSASISLNVETVTTPTPLLLLESYSTGQTDPLQPGQQFALDMTIQNAGVVDVSNLLVTFGTVSTSSAATAAAAAQAAQPNPARVRRRPRRARTSPSTAAAARCCWAIWQPGTRSAWRSRSSPAAT